MCSLTLTFTYTHTDAHIETPFACYCLALCEDRKMCVCGVYHRLTYAETKRCVRACACNETRTDEIKRCDDEQTLVPSFSPSLCGSLLFSFVRSLTRPSSSSSSFSFNQSLTQLRCRFLFFSISVIDTSAHCIQRISFPFYRFRHNIGVDCTLLGYPRW